MFIANDYPAFKTLFIDGLKNMLADDQLGAFILVLANSMQDEKLRLALAPALEKNFTELKQRYLAGVLTAAPDDTDVFEKLLALGMGKLPVWRVHDIGRWRAVVNPMRSLRPPRASNERRASIYSDFDPGTFNFNKPFLKPEIFWEGEYAGSNVRVLFNKFPFVAYHTIVVISPDAQRPQVIDRAAHEYIWSLVQDAVHAIPGFGIGFNSLAAGASVNHQHFQGFIDERALPVESGPGREYPLEVAVGDSEESAWRSIESCLQQDIAFNCLYRKGRCYVLPRRYQGLVELPDWLLGAGWSDLSGLLTVADEEQLSQISSDMIDSSVRSMRPA